MQPDGSWMQAVVSYGYDEIDRLVREKREGSYPYWYEYTYDGSGNRVSMVQKDGSGNVIGQKVYSYDGGNKLMQEVVDGVVVSYQYDPNGNTISKIVGTSVVRYYWDEEDKMVRLEDSVVMNFKTDGLGFRRYKEVVGQSVTYFVYDLAESDTPGLAPLIAEYDANGNLVAKYHHDGGLIAMTRGNQSYWYVFEAIGSVRQLTDAQSQVPDAYFYDAWGNELTSPYSQVPNPFRYVGKHGYYLDTQSALMLLGVRYYDAVWGRFMSIDPIWQGKNWYAYGNDNPAIHIDPEGLNGGGTWVIYAPCADWCRTRCFQIPRPPKRVTPIRRTCNVHQLDRKGCQCLHELIEYARNMVRNFCDLRREPPEGYFPSPTQDPCEGAYAVTYCCHHGLICEGISFHCPLYNNPCPGASEASIGCIQDCIESHEFVHRELCRQWGNVYPPLPYDRIKSECEAWKNTLDCVKKKFMQGQCHRKLPD